MSKIILNNKAEILDCRALSYLIDILSQGRDKTGAYQKYTEINCGNKGYTIEYRRGSGKTDIFMIEMTEVRNEFYDGVK